MKTGFPGGSDGKKICLQCRRAGFNPWVRKIPWEKGMATHSSILAWTIPWTEDPSRLQSIGSQRVGHDWATNTFLVASATLFASLVSIIFLGGSEVKHLPPMRETRVRSLGRENLLEKEMATHSSILAWRIPWTEESGRLQSIGSQRVGHDWATSLSFFLSFWCLLLWGQISSECHITTLLKQTDWLYHSNLGT